MNFTRLILKTIFNHEKKEDSTKFDDHISND